MEIELFDGTVLEFPDDTPSDVVDRVAKLETSKRQVLQSATTTPVLTGSLEAAGVLGSSALATPVAGIAGLLTAGAKAAGLTDMSPASVVEGVQGALTYQPRTEPGQAATSAVSYPFRKLAEGADFLGQKAADASDMPSVGAATNTGVQFLAPLAFLRGVKTLRGLREGPKAATTPEMAAAEATVTPEVRARDFVNRTVGLDWDSLPRAIQAQLTEVARDARNLSALSPDAVRRQANLASLEVPIPATRGQIARDPVQMRNEGNVSASPQGGPIREVYDAQNKALIQNLDVLANRTRGSARTPEDAGRSVQDAGLRAKAAASKANYNKLYEQARATEPDATTSAQPLYELLDGSPEITRLGFMESWLNKAKVTKTEKASDGTVVQTQRGVTLRELYDLRQRATKIARAGGTDAVYAGDVMRAVDAAMENVPAGAAAWGKATAAFRKHKQEFSDQGAVRDLVENFPGTADRRVALENTVRTITRGSLEDIRTVKRSLLTGGDSATRTAGRQAWRDLRQQVIEQIRTEATKGVATLPDGSPNLSVAQLKRAVDGIGPERMNEIFGPGTSQRINKIVSAAQDLKTVPPTSVPVGSSTLQNVLALLGRGIQSMPGIGGPIADTARAVARPVMETRQARMATQNPLAEAAARSQDALARRRAGRNALVATPATVPRETPR